MSSPHALMERKRIVNTVWRFMEGVRLPADADDRARGVPHRPGRTAAHRRPGGGRRAPGSPFSSIANLTGLPAASVPVGFTADGLPIGLQIMGRHLDDRGVLALAAVVEIRPRARWPGLRRSNRPTGGTHALI